MKLRDWTRLFQRYRGKWVALTESGRKVIGSGPSLKSAKRAAEQNGCSDAYFTRIPKKLVNFIGAHQPR